jgi:hypothetical protein
MLLVGVVAIAPFLAGLMLDSGKPGAAPPVVSLPSPLVLLINAGDLAYQRSSGSYWASMVCVSVLSCLLLVGASIRLRRGARREGDAPAKPASSRPSNGVKRSRRWGAFAGEANPVAWRVGRQRGLKATVWTAALVGFFYYFLFAFIARFIGPSSVAGVSWSLGLASSAVIGSLFAWAASRFFVEARRTGELELLLTTPVGAQAIVPEQWKVLARLIRWPVVVMLVPMLLQGIIIIITRPRLGLTGFSATQYAVSVGLGAVNTVLGVGALCWLALWFGLRAGGQARAILWSIALAKVLPYGISVLSSMIRGMLFVPRSGSLSPMYWISSWLPQLLIVGFYLWVIRLARHRLLGDLAAANPMRFDLRQAVCSASRDAAAAFRKARHWTPS